MMVYAPGWISGFVTALAPAPGGSCCWYILHAHNGAALTFGHHNDDSMVFPAFPFQLLPFSRLSHGARAWSLSAASSQTYAGFFDFV